MYALLGFAVLGVLLIVAVKALAAVKPSAAGPAWPVYARRLMNGTEAALFRRLQEALPDHVVLSQVGLSQLVDVKRGKEHQWARNKVFKKVADFVVLNPDLSVLAIVELGGTSHDRKSRQRSDDDKGAALAAAGYRVEYFNAAELPRGAEIRQRLTGKAAALSAAA